MKRLQSLLVGTALAIALIDFSASGARAAGKPAATPAPAAAPTEEPASTAIPRLEAQLKSNPNDKETLIKLASYYLADNQPAKAVPLTQKLISIGVKTPQVYYIDGLSNIGANNNDAAQKSLEAASNLDPTNAQILLALTDLDIRTNRDADAERVAKRAAAFNTKDPRVLDNYGLVLAHERKFDEARTQFDAAYKLNVKDVTALLLAARTYEAQTNGSDGTPSLSHAQELYDKAVTVDPANTDAMIGRARILAAERQVDRAIAQYEQLRGLVPDKFSKAGLLDEEAHVYAVNKQNGEADQAFRRAISQYADVPEAHIAYGDFLVSTQKRNEAVTQWQAALGIDHDQRDALLRLGNYYLDTGDPTRSIENFKRLDGLTPNDPRPTFLLGQAYMQARQFQQARDAFRKSFEMVATPDSFAGIAAADFQLKNYKEAADILDKINANAPSFPKSNPVIYFLMGQTYTAAGQSSKAKDAYARYLPYVRNDAKATQSVKRLIADLAHPSSSPSTAKTAPQGHK